MQKRFLRLAALCVTGLCVSVWLILAAPVLAADGSKDEQAIRALQTRLAASVAARNLDAVMTNYAPGDELFVFDSDLPREHRGWAAFKDDWGNFTNSASAATYEVKELGVTVVGDAAFSHHLAHLSWTAKKDGTHHEQLMSISDAYRRIGGKWLIVMEHFSLPVVNGKAVLMAWPGR